MTDALVMRELLKPLDLSSPYQSRQKIVPVPDDLNIRLDAQLVNSSPGRVNINWDRFIVGPFAVGVAKATWSAIKSLMSKGVEVKPVAWSDLNALIDEGKLRLPAGAPVPLEIYVGNPVSPADYYSAAEFHDRLLEHKLDEARQLLMSLGAYSFETLGLRGTQAERGRRVGAKIPFREVSGARNTSRKGEFAERTEFRLRGSTNPVKPQLGWLPFEPTWQSLVKARIDFGVTQGEIEVMDHRSYGVDSELKGKINGVGLELGGSFSSQKDETFHFVAHFPDDEGHMEHDPGRAQLALPKRPRAAKPKPAKAPSMQSRRPRARKSAAKKASAKPRKK